MDGQSLPGITLHSGVYLVKGFLGNSEIKFSDHYLFDLCSLSVAGAVDPAIVADRVWLTSTRTINSIFSSCQSMAFRGFWVKNAGLMVSG